MMKKFLSSVLVICILMGIVTTAPISVNGAYCDINSTASTSLPSSIYLKQETNYTCTLCSAAMMLRSRMYLSNNSLWSSVTESAIRSTAWVEGSGLKWSWTYSISGNSMSVSHASVSGISISTLKSLLNSHPEGIVLYCGNIPHAVFVTDYDGDTFYCADPASGYSGSRRALSSSYLGKFYGSQANILSKVTAYWYVSSYSINSTPAGYNPIGGIDGVSSPSPGKITVIGWAYDPDDTSAQIDVHIYVGGPSGSGEKHIIKANTYQKSVDDTYHCGLYHGFFATFDTNKTGNQPIYAYGINIGGGTANTQLYGVPKTVYINSDNEKPVISNVTVSQVTSKGYRVSCKVSDNIGVTSVKFPSWESSIGASDVKWHVGTVSENIATCYIPMSEHSNRLGTYITHIYAYDSAGNYSSVSTGNITVTDEPKEISSVKYNGNTYKVFNSGKTWAEAKQWCEKQGGHLATITSENERIAINGALEKFNGVPCWLGAESTSGTWKWVTGENFNYTNWSTGQPDCGSNAEFYLGTFDSTKKWLDCYLWNDYSSDGASRIGGFVCEFEKKETPTETVTEKPTQPTTVKPTEPTEPTQPTTETKATEPAETTAPTTETTEPATQATEAKPSEAPTVPAEGTFYVVAGCPELCNGAEWDPASPLNLMTLGDDGVYRITYSNVSVGTYVFKVTTNGAWDNGEFNLVGNAMYGGPNAEITVTEDNSTVVISFKESDMHANAYINGVLVDVGTTKPTEAPASTNPTSNPQSTKCSHSYKKITTKAPTYFAEGKGVVKCVKCHDFKGSVIFLKKLLKIPSVTISGDKKSIKIRYKKAVKDATGFVVKYSEKGKKKYYTKSFKTKEKTTKYIKNLKKNKKYTVSVRAYIKSGKKIAYSAWTKAKTVKVK